MDASISNRMKNKTKSKKSVFKRFKISSRGKLQHRHVRMDHFNARDSGNERRRKRQQRLLTGKEMTEIKKLIPYAD
jgi:ribosomal protein L35